MSEDRFEDFVGLITAVAKEIQRIKTVELARFGLRASDLMCVYTLQHHPDGLTAAELARTTSVDRAAVSRVVSHLKEAGIVEIGGEEDATTSERYRAPIRLSEKGSAVMLEVNDIIRRIVDQAGSGLSDESRRIMYDSLSSVYKELKEISK